MDERWLGIGQSNLGLKYVEARHGAGLVAVPLIFQLLGEEVHGLLVRDDERPVEDDLGEVDFHVGDHLVDCGSKLEVGTMLTRNRRSDARNGGSAIIEELVKLEIDIPNLVIHVRAADFYLIQFARRVAIIGRE